ncbi:segregation/condensation protein A [Desulfurispirillum indicum]|uniref:segregation and condensation protein A n=1 Tax=Desulfurispirillum indicum TaxID=936456 RepID=UPI001CFA820A|nr:segregation/condensation protein A [Desulfurispirillum indicum]UCZ56160.1 segregation/condensation protein A [Desulfurispirillum indicum]
MYSISVQDFEGPMDLLLHLIYKNEMDITTISISAIADEYLEYIETMQDLALDVCGDFFVMASTLALIKSRALLAESEGAGEEVAKELVQKLREYKKYRALSQGLDALEVAASCQLTRGMVPEITEEVEVEVEMDFDLFDLLEAYCHSMQNFQVRRKHEITLSTINLVEHMEKVADYIENAGQTCFRYLCSLCQSRQEVVVTFIALLELTRLGRLQLEVREGDIWCQPIITSQIAS